MTIVEIDGGIIYIRQTPNGVGQQYSTDNQNWKTIDWSFIIINTSTNQTLSVQFTTDITFNKDNDQYFVIGSDNIEIDGSNKVVTINGLKNYPGLIQNGTSNEKSYTNINIKNIGLETNDSATLAEGGGWICQEYFGSKLKSGSITVENSYSTGPISSNGGGIFGSYAGYKSYIGSISVISSYSTGSIGEGAGGIFGINAGEVSKNFPIVASYSYSTGSIGVSGGGIFGSAAGFKSNGFIVASYSYSTGSIGKEAGGIFGTDAYSTALNCYTIGTIKTKGNGIFGSENSGSTNKNSIASDGKNWSDATASKTIGSSTDTGSDPTYWLDYSLKDNAPWLLEKFNATIYEPNKQTINYEEAGTSKAGLFTDTYTYLIVSVNEPVNKLVPAKASDPNAKATLEESLTPTSSITIDDFTGVLTFPNDLSPGTYTINVLVGEINSRIYSAYNYNTYELTVTFLNQYKNTPLYKKGYNFAFSNPKLLAPETLYGIAKIVLKDIDPDNYKNTFVKEAYTNLESLYKTKSQNNVDISADILYLLSSSNNDDSYNIINDIYDSYQNVFTTLNATTTPSQAGVMANNIATSPPFIFYGGDYDIKYTADFAYSSQMVQTSIPVTFSAADKGIDLSVATFGGKLTLTTSKKAQVTASKPDQPGYMALAPIGGKTNLKTMAGVAYSAPLDASVAMTSTAGVKLNGTVSGEPTEENVTGSVQFSYSYNSTMPDKPSFFTSQGAFPGKLPTSAGTTAGNLLNEKGTKTAVASSGVSNIIAAANVVTLQVAQEDVMTNVQLASGVLSPDEVAGAVGNAQLEAASRAPQNSLGIPTTSPAGQTVIRTPEVSYSDIDGVIGDLISELSKLGDNAIYINVQDFKNQSYTISLELTDQATPTPAGAPPAAMPTANVLVFKFTINSINDYMNQIYEATITFDGNNKLISTFYDVLYKSLGTYNFIPTGEKPENYHSYDLSSFTGDENNSFFTLNMKISRTKILP